MFIICPMPGSTLIVTSRLGVMDGRSAELCCNEKLKVPMK